MSIGQTSLPSIGFALLEIAAGQSNQGGVPIDDVHRLFDPLASRNSCWPIGKGCSPDAPSNIVPLKPEACVLSPGGGPAVVARKNDQRLFSKAGINQRLFDLADGFVHGSQHSREHSAIPDRCP